MSTNYYLIKKNHKKTQNELMNHLENNEFDDVKEIIHDMSEGIHLYQRASGWKCAIDYHKGKYYDKSIDSFLNFIQQSIDSGDWVLINEYGTEFPDNDIVKDDIETFAQGICGDDYDRKHPDPYYKCGKDEEVVDGKVRFCFYEDFC